jgi:hypothetical protein
MARLAGLLVSPHFYQLRLTISPQTELRQAKWDALLLYSLE